MQKVKYIIQAILMISFGIGGYVQLATSNSHVTPMSDTVAGFNAYIQIALFLTLFVWLAHKAISATEIKTKKPVTNARDRK